METSVAEVHAYPLRPEGYEEPLFPTRESRLAVAEHLLRTPWLERASGLTGYGGRTAHARREPVRVENRGGRVWVSRPRRRASRASTLKGHVVEWLDRWREIGRWWDERARVDRLVVKVALSNGSVVDLARENPGGWFLVGVED